MKRKKNQKAIQHINRRRKGLSALCSALCLLALTVIGSYTLYYHNRRAFYDETIAVQEHAIEDINKTRASLYAQVEDIRTSEEVLKIARFQLGMVYPEEDQIEYIEVARTEEEIVEDNVFANPVISVLRFLRP